MMVMAVAASHRKGGDQHGRDGEKSQGSSPLIGTGAA
jgi:hypothetical protein